MAAGGTDGSLKFDTKVDDSGFKEGTNGLKGAMERLTSSIEKLTDQIVRRFNGVGQAIEAAGEKAEKSADGVDEIAEAAKRAKKETQSLQEQMDAIQIHHMDDTPVGATELPSTSELSSGDSMNYDPKAMAATFGNAAAEIHNYAEAVELFGASAGMSMNEMSKETISAINASSDGAREAESNLVSTREFVLNAFKHIPDMLAKIFSATTSEMRKIPGIVKNSFARSAESVRKFGRSIRVHLVEGVRKATHSLIGIGKASNSVSKSILKLSSMFKLMLIRMVLRAAIQGVRDGMQNLVQYSGNVNAMMSSLSSSMLYLKNSFAAGFAPILDFVVPALNTLINVIASALAWIAQLFAALSGKSTFVRAKKTQEDYAKSLQKTGGSAKQAGKEADRSTASFDKLNVIAENGSAGGGSGGGAGGIDPSQMFETVEVENRFSNMANSIRNILSDLFQPFKEAWNKEGASTIDAAKYALSSLQKLASSVGKSFMDVWTNGTGTQVVETHLQITQNLLNTIGAICEKLNEAWNINEIGTQIIQNAFNLYQIILDTVNGITLATAVWAAQIDFTPLLESVNAILVAMQPLTDRLGEGLEWFWSNVLLPIASWTIEDAVPAFLDMLAVAIETVDIVLEAFEPAGIWLWDNFLKPIGNWTGGAIVSVLNGIAKVLKTIGDWVNKHSVAVSEFGKIMGVVGGAFVSAHAGIILVNAVLPVLASLIQGAVAVITGPVGIVAAIAAMVVAMGNGKEFIDSIKTALSGLIDFVSGVFTGDWKRAWEGVKNIFKGIFNSIIIILESAINFMISGLNKLSFDVPDWVPGIGGNTFGFELREVRLPRLASGTVVPPRAGEFAAILGDNNREAEVVSPISAMKQAFKEAMSEMGGSGDKDIHVTLYLEGKQIFDEMVKQSRQEHKRTGRNPLLT